MDNEKRKRIELANFLKMKRSKILPSQVGLPDGMRRRTLGLRREEVSYLAEIGLTWYTWLEQGRPIKVSPKILNKLSDIFLLSKEERRYLFALAHQNIPTELLTSKTNIDDSIQNLIDSLKLSPAYIIDQKWNILAWNNAASVLFGNFYEKETEERNVVWLMFMDDFYKKLCINWNEHAQDLVARFRSVYSRYINDEWFSDFIKKMIDGSSEFNYWWSQYDIQSIDTIDKRFLHPLAGNLEFECVSLDVSNNTNLKVFIHTPCAESDTREKMEKLI